MSTNPFRQTRVQPDVQFAAHQSTQTPILSDGSGSRSSDRNDLSIDIKVVNDAIQRDSLQRHVSFASPPVDSTIPAASYPSSPESARSPPGYFARNAALATPDYRTAILSNPFENLRGDQQDGTLQQAVSNAQTNLAVSQPEPTQESTVRDTLGRFASAPSRPPGPDLSPFRPALPDSRKSLDVDAFKRLLLTGNTNNETALDQQSSRRPAPPPPRTVASNTPTAQKTPATTFGLTSPPVLDSSELNAKKASFIDSLVPSGEGKSSLDAAGKLPPPAPAPRRAKSVRTRDLSPLPTPLANDAVSPSEGFPLYVEKPSKKPPAPPLARRQSQRIPSNKSDDNIPTPSPTGSPAEPARSGGKPPPPPPVRRQPSVTARMPSQELAPTIEESGPGPIPTSGSRRSSMDRPPPSGSRNTSNSMKRPNPGLMSPPPLPPPRRGRGSSRSSVDSFRPSLATSAGDEMGQENTFSTESSRRGSAKDRSSLTLSNADSILAELANLRKEVDAARRT